MKRRIFMYLFIFSVLLIVFQYVNSKNILDKYEEDIARYKTTINEQREKIVSLEDRNFELNDFTINNNEEAYTYFEKKGFDIEKLIPAISDGLFEMNNYSGEDHPIVPFVSMTDSKLLINKVRIINHRWILANFSDGENWGEIFVSYHIEKDGNLKYTLEDYFLYPKAY